MRVARQREGDAVRNTREDVGLVRKQNDRRVVGDLGERAG